MALRILHASAPSTERNERFIAILPAEMQRRRVVQLGENRPLKVKTICEIFIRRKIFRCRDAARSFEMMRGENEDNSAGSINPETWDNIMETLPQLR